MSKYQIVIDFECDTDAYEIHAAATLEGILAVLPYIVDNVDINYFILEDSDESEG